MNEAIIIPVIDPGERLITLVDALAADDLDRIVVVDDGSSDTHDALFAALSERDVAVLHHSRNRGKGAAIKTGLAYAETAFPEASGFITVDGDGQHLPEDVRRICAAAEEAPDAIVLGTRDFSSDNVPARSRIGNRFSAAFFKIDTGVACTDTQTGLRFIPAWLVPLALSCPGERYDYEMNFLTKAAKSGVPIVPVPVQTVYLDGNSESHFRPVRDSLLVFCQLLRFAASSLICSVADLGIFALIVALAALPASPLAALSTSLLVAIATAAARACSGVMNFALNRSFSFKARNKRIADQAVRYAILFFSQMIASMLAVAGLGNLDMPLVAAKIMVDVGLFFVSYFAQRNWVFKEAQPQCEPPSEERGAPHGSYKTKRPTI